MLIFSPRGAKEACGMFTLPHIIAFVICIVLIILGIYFTKKIKKEEVFKIIKIVAIVVIILEIIKIGYNFYYDYTYLDSWFPLAYCSLFIYSTTMAGFGKGLIRKIGVSFLVGGGIIAGMVFLILPTTSLMMHPIYHYLSIHSMLFHSLMVYVGILCYIHELIEFKKKDYLYYVIFCMIFIVLALIINSIYDCNMMFLKEPFNIPIPLLHKICDNYPLLYKIIVILAFLVIPYGATSLIHQLIKKGREKRC